MTVEIGRLVAGPQMMEIVDLRPGSVEESKRFCLDLISSFGIVRLPSPSPSLSHFPEFLGPEELRAANLVAGRKFEE